MADGRKRWTYAQYTYRYFPAINEKLGKKKKDSQEKTLTGEIKRVGAWNTVQKYGLARPVLRMKECVDFVLSKSELR